MHGAWGHTREYFHEDELPARTGHRLRCGELDERRARPARRQRRRGIHRPLDDLARPGVLVITSLIHENAIVAGNVLATGIDALTTFGSLAVADRWTRCAPAQEGAIPAQFFNPTPHPWGEISSGAGATWSLRLPHTVLDSLRSRLFFI